MYFDLNVDYDYEAGKSFAVNSPLRLNISTHNILCHILMTGTE